MGIRLFLFEQANGNADAAARRNEMKENIHPKYVESTVTCACGYSFKTWSTKPVIRLDICSHCHPFFTGKQKLLDTAGRVDRFKKKYKTIEPGKAVKKEKHKKQPSTKRFGRKILTMTPARKQKTVKENEAKKK